MSAGPIIVEATGIRAVFRRSDDRWMHEIELMPRSRAPVVVMQSLEGDDDDPYPPSPVIQDVAFQVEPDGTPAAMGIGHSACTHWSLSCRALPLGGVQSSWFSYLLFEVACRSSEGFERVGTCYRILPEVKPHETSQYMIYRSTDGDWTAGSSTAVISNTNQTLRMDLFGEMGGLFPQTVQWSYVINRLRKSPAS